MSSTPLSAGLAVPVRAKDVQVLHGFDSMEHAKAYLETKMFQDDVVAGLKPTWAGDPDIRFYTVA